MLNRILADVVMRISLLKAYLYDTCKLYRDEHYWADAHRLARLNEITHDIPFLSNLFGSCSLPFGLETKKFLERNKKRKTCNFQNNKQLKKIS